MRVRDSGRLALFVLLGAFGCLLLSLALAHFLSRVVHPTQTLYQLLLATAYTTVIATPLLVWLGLKQQKASQLRHNLAQAVARDSLTQCLNGPTFSALVDAYSTGLQEGPPKGALIVIETDDFHLLKEQSGRSAADQALRVIAGAIRRSVRNGDLIGRLGDATFGVFLPGAGPENTADIVERIRLAVAEIHFAPEGRQYALTVTGGAILFDDETAFDTLYRVADRRLRQVRSEGRHGIEVHRFSADLPDQQATPPTRH